MATDFSSRPKPPLLKRFANLDIDGVDKPARAAAPPPVVAPQRGPQVKAQAQSQDADQDIRDFQALAAELNDNVKNTQPTPGSGPRSRFTLPMPDNAQNRARAQRAAEIAAQRPPDPAYFTLRERAERAPPTPPPTMTRSTVTVPLRPPDRAATTTTRTMRAPRVPPNTPLWELPRETPTGPSGYDFDVDDFGGTPGVMTVEMDLRRSPRQARPARSLAPLELTPMAARQIMLMSWEAGVPGSALRVLTSASPGLGRPELDFAFDEHIEPDDLVFETHGVTIVIDPGSLRWVAGRRITWHDVPGSEGFRIG